MFTNVGFCSNLFTLYKPFRFYFPSKNTHDTHLVTTEFKLDSSVKEKWVKSLQALVPRKLIAVVLSMHFSRYMYLCYIYIHRIISISMWGFNKINFMFCAFETKYVTNLKKLWKPIFVFYTIKVWFYGESKFWKKQYFIFVSCQVILETCKICNIPILRALTWYQYSTFNVDVICT